MRRTRAAYHYAIRIWLYARRGFHSAPTFCWPYTYGNIYRPLPMDVTCMDSCTSVQFTFVSSASAVHHNYVVTLYEHFIRDFYVHFKGTRTNICVSPFRLGIRGVHGSTPDVFLALTLMHAVVSTRTVTSGTPPCSLVNSPIALKLF